MATLDGVGLGRLAPTIQTILLGVVVDNDFLRRIRSREDTGFRAYFRRRSLLLYVVPDTRFLRLALHKHRGSGCMWCIREFRELDKKRTSSAVYFCLSGCDKKPDSDSVQLHRRDGTFCLLSASINLECSMGDTRFCRVLHQLHLVQHSYGDYHGATPRCLAFGANDHACHVLLDAHTMVTRTNWRSLVLSQIQSARAFYHRFAHTCPRQ